MESVVQGAEAENGMQSENNIAFKEWAVVVAALSQGHQTLILRKGGIQEQGGEFRPEHGEFWLFPTQFHQQADALNPSAAPLLSLAQTMQPPHGQIHLSAYAVVQDVVHITDERTLFQLAGTHVLSEQTVSDRFHYRRPGLYVLITRMFVGPSPHVLVDSPHFAGCRTWVDLPESLSTNDLQPVLNDAKFGSQRTELLRRLTSGRVA